MVVRFSSHNSFLDEGGPASYSCALLQRLMTHFGCFLCLASPKNRKHNLTCGCGYLSLIGGLPPDTATVLTVTGYLNTIIVLEYYNNYSVGELQQL